MSIKLRQELELRIIRAIIKEALAVGITVSVYDGEEWTVKNSEKLSDIMKAVMTTDEDTLRFNTCSGERIGDVLLVYGNDGWDVIADHTESIAMNNILAPGNAIANRYA